MNSSIESHVAERLLLRHRSLKVLPRFLELMKTCSTLRPVILLVQRQGIGE